MLSLALRQVTLERTQNGRLSRGEVRGKLRETAPQPRSALGVAWLMGKGNSIFTLQECWSDRRMRGMRSGLRKGVAAALLGAMAGCTAVRPVAAPAPFISAKHPDVVYVWDKQGRVFSIARPVVQGDSVVGVSPRLDKSVGLPLS